MDRLCTDVRLGSKRHFIAAARAEAGRVEHREQYRT